MHDQDCICCTQGSAAAKGHMDMLIEKYGHGVITTGTEHHGEKITMAYTLGLYERGLPELLVFTLPAQVAGMLLNEAAELLKRGELSLDAPCTQLANLPVAFVAVSPEDAADYIVQANNRANRSLPVWQMVWTDTQGNFPWDAEFEARFQGKQPLLGSATAAILTKTYSN